MIFVSFVKYNLTEHHYAVFDLFLFYYFRHLKTSFSSHLLFDTFFENVDYCFYSFVCGLSSVLCIVNVEETRNENKCEYGAREWDFSSPCCHPCNCLGSVFRSTEALNKLPLFREGTRITQLRFSIRPRRSVVRFGTNDEFFCIQNIPLDILLTLVLFLLLLHFSFCFPFAFFFFLIYLRWMEIQLEKLYGDECFK